MKYTADNVTVERTWSRCVEDIVALQLALGLEDCPDYQAPKIDILRKGVSRSLDAGSYYIAEAENNTLTVGCARVQYMESDWEADRRAFIDGVYVLPAYRRRGIARRLIQRIIVDNATCCDIQLAVKKDNVAAVALYQSLGFTDEGYISLTRWANAVKQK